MIAALTGPDAHAPLGLAQLVSPLEPEERMAFLREREGGGDAHRSGGRPALPRCPPTPSSALIMTRLRADNGVVVQGPPGTGKTHSIANLLSALLAQGQRVLVTSQKAQALRVLRDKLPDGDRQPVRLHDRPRPGRLRGAGGRGQGAVDPVRHLRPGAAGQAASPRSGTSSTRPAVRPPS